ncbi:hypothetical protein [Mastigocoleus testarum]|uniref:Uncharacterized protein n=1 Tax=Mastigocoleus testarum BC008 TaxID=371196 RepID=A0A0V7ZPX0_9CYAN|nr:hypothetical protein [Mastigocoleus testarum]KST66756.1 hypothetical protein BC008_26575 [Mastigocoleus testarum BC008]
MNTHTFDNHYLTCPICQKDAAPKPIKSCTGLYTCPYCQERIVVCKSGNYVRDPFVLKRIMISSTLRRQSQPIARILRDFVLLKRPLLSFMVGIFIVLGVLATSQQHTDVNNTTQQELNTDKQE